MFFNLYIIFFFFLFFFGFIFFLFGMFFLFYDFIFIFDWEFISFNSCIISFTMIFDWISMFFSSCVFFISSMVILYSKSYMSNDDNNIRFLFLVLMFIFFMFMMVISPNFISILIGWDGLGLVSYCLVVYFNNYNSCNAGMLTILVNRLGDVSILIGIGWMMNFGSWHYFYYLFFYEDWIFYLIFLIIIAGFTKSAQIPFSSWLPAAMAAPTPVSSLVHSSTLVTAGVYLIIRFNDLLFYVDCSFFIIISILTMFMSGLGANFEYDLKKIIALSTLSQLGLMMMILFLGFPILSFFHLLTHAFFKALLFLCSGLIIHCMNDSQDIRYMGGLVNQIPFTMTCFCISNFSLCGFPYLSGFYSKDLILEFCSFYNTNFFFYFILYFSVGLTVSYSFRLLYYCLFYNVNFYVCQSFFEDFLMNFSMIFLSFMSVFFGSLFSWLIFKSPIFLVMTFYMKLMSIFFIFFGVFMGFYFFNLNVYGDFFLINFYNYVFFFGSIWFFPNFNTYYFSDKGYFFSYYSCINFDYGWGEYLVSNFFSLIVYFFSSFNEFFYYNNFSFYMITFFFIFILFLF